MGNCRSKKRRNDVGDSLNPASSNVNRRRLRLGGAGGYGDIGNVDYSNFMSGQVIHFNNESRRLTESKVKAMLAQPRLGPSQGQAKVRLYFHSPEVKTSDLDLSYTIFLVDIKLGIQIQGGYQGV